MWLLIELKQLRVLPCKFLCARDARTGVIKTEVPREMKYAAVTSVWKQGTLSEIPMINHSGRGE